MPLGLYHNSQFGQTSAPLLNVTPMTELRDEDWDILLNSVSLLIDGTISPGMTAALSVPLPAILSGTNCIAFIPTGATEELLVVGLELFSGDVARAPEPAALAVLAAGAIGLLRRRRRAR